MPPKKRKVEEVATFSSKGKKKSKASAKRETSTKKKIKQGAVPVARKNHTEFKTFYVQSHRKKGLHLNEKIPKKRNQRKVS